MKWKSPWVLGGVFIVVLAIILISVGLTVGTVNQSQNGVVQGTMNSTYSQYTTFIRYLGALPTTDPRSQYLTQFTFSYTPFSRSDNIHTMEQQINALS